MRTEVMIPMRDGVKLHAVILRPADIATPLPILMERTPYGVDETSRASFFAQRPELARDGYIYVGEDIRGRYKSQGKFVMMRPLADHHDPKAIDESTDAYDTVAWLIKNVPGNNGRVGVVGTSYPGFLAMMAGIDPHPAVKAISPQAPMIDVWLGDDFFHNGAFRQSYGYDYVLAMESSKEDTDVDYGKDKDGQSRRRLRLLSRARQLCRGREAIRRQAAAHLEALPRSSRLRLRLVLARRGVRAQHRGRAHAYRRRLLRPGRYVGPAGGVRPAGAARYASREFSGAWAVASRVVGRRRRSTWAISTTASLSARSFAPGSRQSSSPTTSKTRPASILKTRPAFRPARTRGSITRTFRRRNRSQQAFIFRATAC